MSQKEMKQYIKNYCREVGSCGNCALNLPDAPMTHSCYTWVEEQELIDNYNWIKSHN